MPAANAFSANVGDVSKIELTGTTANMAVKVNYENNQFSLLLTGLPQSVMSLAPIAASGSDAQLYFETTKPTKSPGDAFYVAKLDGRFEVRL